MREVPGVESIEIRDEDNIKSLKINIRVCRASDSVACRVVWEIYAIEEKLYTSGHCNMNAMLENGICFYGASFSMVRDDGCPLYGISHCQAAEMGIRKYLVNGDFVSACQLVSSVLPQTM